MKKLSAYTVASNCTDLTDIRDGIAEIHEAMKTCVESGKHIPSFYVSRLAKLETKKKKLEKRTQVHMTVTIRFFIPLQWQSGIAFSSSWNRLGRM